MNEQIADQVAREHAGGSVAYRAAMREMSGVLGQTKREQGRADAWAALGQIDRLYLLTVAGLRRMHEPDERVAWDDLSPEHAALISGAARRIENMMGALRAVGV